MRSVGQVLVGFFVFAHVPAAADWKERCEAQIEAFVEDVRQKKGHKSTGSMLKDHDANQDDHVSEDEVLSLFREAGVEQRCMELSSQAMQHLLHLHDHNDDGKLSHEEATRHRESIARDLL
eukprot:TRINITY_DN75961_c0_g1_i1.p1 TRINITY_DN75961_c0_g1~~TRINITY_DN75961_c0_g1_i1.p1  ORF type:complete len:138 (-),score=29.26 TRINITY_DN75961_c0_g1_i1:67-429(-)